MRFLPPKTHTQHTPKDPASGGVFGCCGIKIQSVLSVRLGWILSKKGSPLRLPDAYQKSPGVLPLLIYQAYNSIVLLCIH